MYLPLGKNIQLFVKVCHLSLNGATQYCRHFLEFKM